MQNEILRRFNGDVATKGALYDFIIQVIGQEAIDRTFKGFDVSHIKDAKDLIDRVYDELENLYGLKIETTTKENQSK